MINRLEVVRYGPLKQLAWPQLGPINLILGGSGTGKTFILKALYSTLRTLEECGRGDSPRSASAILADRLYWTFQPERIGDLVSKGEDGPLELRCWIDEKLFGYSFGRDTVRQISQLENQVSTLSSNCVFMPAKEVLSLHSLILESRERDQRFGFDDTYYDLARALRIPAQQGKSDQSFAQVRGQLEGLLGGRVEHDERTGKWSFRHGSQRFPMGVTAEGVKKLAILETLLGNRHLGPNSVVFLDEPESALHPSALTSLLEMIASLAERGLQFFLASHSYFVVKKLGIIAQELGIPVPVLSAVGNSWQCADLRDGLPDNSITQESIRLYEQELALSIG